MTIIAHLDDVNTRMCSTRFFSSGVQCGEMQKYNNRATYDRGEYNGTELHWKLMYNGVSLCGLSLFDFIVS